MKIGIDCRLYSPKFTGIGRYVFEFLKYLAELDTKNEYVLFFNQPEYDSYNVPNERWQKKLVNIPHYSLAEQWKYSRILKAEKLDLMYFPHFNAPVLYKEPFVATIHDLTLHYYPYKEYQPHWSPLKQLKIWAYRFIMGRTVRNSQHLIAVSGNTKYDLLKEYNLSDSKISVILEGVPENFQKSSPHEIEAVRNKYQISKLYLLYTGVWRSHKNLLNLIRAFHLLIKQGKDIQLVLTGKKDPAYPEIPSLIKALELDKRVITTGFVSEEELIALNSDAHIFVFPSLYEGFGLPPLEAMQFGVPVACSKVSSLPQVCGDAALYFDPHDIHEMSQTMLKLLDDDQLRADLIAKGTENLKRFSWKKMTREIIDIFNEFS